MNIQSMDKYPQDKRLQILETALKLFVSQGLQQTSMAQISKVSSIAVGTIYHHFESKDVLVQEIYLHIKKNFGQATLFSESERNLNYKERFAIKMRKTYDFFTEQTLYFLFDEMHNHSPLISKELKEKAAGYYQESNDFILEGVEKGILSAKHIHIIGPWVFNAISTLIKIHINKEAKLSDNDLIDFFEMTWNGMTSMKNTSHE